MRFEDECQDEESESTFFTRKIFKHILKQFADTKNIVVIDLVSEYTKHMKKADNDKAKVDLEANLLKTIAEYENMLKITEDD